MNVAFGTVGTFLSMTGFERSTLMGQLVSLAVAVALSVALIPSMGASGAALGVAAGIVTRSLVLGVEIWKRLGLRPSIV